MSARRRSDGAAEPPDAKAEPPDGGGERPDGAAEADGAGEPLPTARETPLDPPPRLAALRARCPVAPMRYADGHAGRLVTRHDLAVAVLTDPRFGSRPEVRHPAFALAADDDDDADLPDVDVPGTLIGMDPPEHTRYRRLLAPELTARAAARLAPRVARHAARLAGDLVPGDDLVTGYADPLVSAALGELLGLGPADRERARGPLARTTDPDASLREVLTAYGEVADVARRRVARARAAPGPATSAPGDGGDLVGRLAASGALTDRELTGVVYQLLAAGQETTASMVALGVLALLTHPGQRDAVRADPGLLDGAVEELLRHLTVAQFGLSRGALVDVALGGVTVGAGTTVTVSLPAANRDPAHFADPDVLDVRRSARGHLAFGAGIHRCLGRHVARVVLRVALGTLLARRPGLRLAVPAAELRMRERAVTYGVVSLPVDW